eukprot:jgi/Chrzof1/3731/Cz13g06260.t1
MVYSDDFTHGRATYYTDNTQGSCRYGTDIPEFYAAYPNVQEGFDGSCGRCFEVACDPTSFSDGFGEWQDRAHVCHDVKKSVVVKIVDSCPCYQADNYWSNKRWCCGDMQHIDLADNVFAQLADTKWGVIGLKWRQADCSRLGVRYIDGDSTSNSQSNSSPAAQSNQEPTQSNQQSEPAPNTPTADQGAQSYQVPGGVQVVVVDPSGNSQAPTPPSIRKSAW